MDLGKVLALRPVMDLLDLGFVRNTPIKGVFVPDDSHIWHSENELFSGYHCTNIFQLLENLVDDLEVLPDEAVNAQIVRDGLIRAIWVFYQVVTDLMGRSLMNG